MCARAKKDALYVLAPEEELIFELNIDNASLKEDDKDSNGILDLIENLLPMLGKPASGEGMFVVTNSRCIVVLRKKTRSFLGFCRSEERLFWTFPRHAITEWHSYEKASRTCCWCCTGQGFDITIGLDGKEANSLTIHSKDITSDEEAQALISLLIELSQKS